MAMRPTGEELKQALIKEVITLPGGWVRELNLSHPLHYELQGPLSATQVTYRNGKPQFRGIKLTPLMDINVVGYRTGHMGVLLKAKCSSVRPDDIEIPLARLISQEALIISDIEELLSTFKNANHMGVEHQEETQKEDLLKCYDEAGSWS